MKANKNLNKKT